MGSTVAMDQYICGTTQGFLFFCSFKFYEVLQHANQSTNFCLTTLESWNFLIKREVLVIDICGKSCCLFSTKKMFADLARCSRCLLPPLAVYQWSIVSYQQAFLEYCASLTHNNIKINRQKKSKDVAVSELRQCQADTPWNFLLWLNWWVILCNAMKSEWEYSSSFVQPSPSKFLFPNLMYLPHPHSQRC